MGRRKNLRDRSQRHDAAYRQAKQEGFAARAVYKLRELDKRFRLLGPGKRVLDLGCWPGSWLQYAAEKVGSEGLVVGIDLRPVDVSLPPWVETVTGDVEHLDLQRVIERWGEFDVVLSDMAPQTSGDKATDQWRSEALFEQAHGLATRLLRPGGHFAGKVFQGGRFPELLAALRAEFQEARAFRAPSSRKSSTEQYLVGRGLRASRRPSGE
jgi:23S rRNA (uridine2552-2'-O)-methyltransferase